MERKTEGKRLKDYLLLLLTTSIWGSIGVLRCFIPLPPATFSLCRGLIGGTFVLLWMLVTRHKFDRSVLWKNKWNLVGASAGLAFNWILLFECIDECGVSFGTICYYLGPVIVILLSSRMFGEKLTPRKIIGSIGAFAGLVLASGVFEGGDLAVSAYGLTLGLGSAILFATVTMLNKKMGNVNAMERTTIEMFGAVLFLIPYVLMVDDLSSVSLSTSQIVLLAVIGVIHTGFCYIIYFGSMGKLDIQTVSIFTYADPVVSLILSAVVLSERMGVLGTIGSIMVIASALLAEL